MKFKILIPVYNDWQSVSKLLDDINFNLLNLDHEISVIIINDASNHDRNEEEKNFENISSIKILNMKINQGHARCNATGLKFLIEKEEFNHVILMDGDGEDRPEELGLLFNKVEENPTKTVTANRIKRSEGVLFKLLYELHKILTYFFTGKLIKFGNYSCLTKEDASKIAKESCVWSSFSGSVTKIIANRIAIPSIRGKRYFGPSQMNLLNLLIHSLSIIAVFKKTVIIRSIFFLILYLFFISGNFSIITLFPVAFLIIFVLMILKTSSRENMNELNNCLKNIHDVETLSNFDGGQ